MSGQTSEASKPRILVVDGDRDIVDVLAKSLESRDFEVRTASDGREALEIFAATPPDLVVLETLLPDVSGFEVCHEIQNQLSDREIPVIFITEDPAQESLVRAFAAGAADYIRKPFRLREVMAKVVRQVGRSSEVERLRHRTDQLEDELARHRDEVLRMRKEIKRQAFSFKTVVGLAQDLNRTLDREDLTKYLLLTSMGQVGVSTVALYYQDESRSEIFRLQGCRGISAEKFDGLEFYRHRGLAARLQQEPEIFDLDTPTTDRILKEDLESVGELGFAFASPIVNKSCLDGFLLSGEKINGGDYGVGDAIMLTSLCHLAATGLANARLYHQLRETYLSTLRVLMNTLEAKHPYTRGHTERVARYATAIARAMNLSKEERERITFGAVLHDIGKMAVHDSILNKPSQLSESEWEIVRNHPEIGANILSGMKFLEGVTDYVRFHHERIDGRGYPTGLAGEEIPLGARIIAVADTFDAITSSRTYNKQEGWNKAITILESKSGSHFDETVVGHFARIIRSGVFKPRNEDADVAVKSKPSS